MKMKKISTEQFLEDKYKELQVVRSTMSEFERRLSEIVNAKDIADESKIVLIRSAYTRTLGEV